MRQKLNARRIAAVFFSLIMASLQGLGGLLAGWSLWARFGPAARDVDDTNGYHFGLLVGVVLAVCGGVTYLWKSWPRTRSGGSESSVALDRKSLAP